jgi:hypothetical protein
VREQDEAEISEAVTVKLEHPHSDLGRKEHTLMLGLNHREIPRMRSSASVLG